ncbi:hypothetical protein XO10_07025 [Marinitoga sp. 1135]|uniref:ABC transporter substrate-binding protein n=1 Tax=Marinitoga sp. 1135 TaxID=1643333 RepID=UPI001585F08E|nr:ABC transporter substrate-binding protein [Marinitoga sp. 1135]NUU96026.1 hypothetical protein [Marinitoga sp. 1135]
MKKIFIFIFIILLISVFLIISCSKNPVKVGVITALSGRAMPSGKSLIEAINLYIRENNLESNITVIPADDSWDQEKIEKEYNRLKKEGVRFIIFGTTSSSLNRVYKKLKTDNILGLVISATSPKFKGIDDRIIRTIPDTEKEQKEIANFLNKKNIKDIFVIVDSSNPVYTEAAYEYFKTYFKGHIEHLKVNFKTDGYIDLITNAYKNQNNVYIIAGLIGEVGMVIQELKLTNSNVNIITTPWVRSKGLEIAAGDYLKNVIVPSHYPYEYTGKLKDFYDYFINDLKEEPSLHAFLGYEIMQIFWETYKSGNNTPEKMEKFITEHEFKTIFGNVKFDKYGESSKNMYFGIYDGNKWVEIIN